MDGGQALENSGRTGTYQIVWAGGAVESENYDITLLPGTLRVINRPAPPPPPTPTVSGGRAENGSFTISDEYASAGETVDITPAPDEGYVVDQVTVTDSDGGQIAVTDNGDGTYSFVMPGKSLQPVKVTVTFKVRKDESVLEAFTDIDPTEWYAESVDYVVSRGLMVGVGDDRFSPNGTTTRGMVVRVLYRLAEEPAAGKSSFEDVPDSLWYSDAVTWAAANNIVSGYSDTRFGPNDPITREQMAAILYRFAQFMEADVSKLADLSAYSDADKISPWAVDAIKWCVHEGIIAGMSDTILSPGSLSTRAMVAVVLANFCKDIEE